MASKSKKKQCYKAEYSSKWEFIKPSSKKGEHHAACTICGLDFSIAASGSYDITTHIKTAKHSSNAAQKSSNRSITQFLPASNDQLQLIRAETTWTLFVIEHNLPFVTSDGFSNIVKEMFPDSKIARDFGCRRTKTTSITRALGQETRGELPIFSLFLHPMTI